VCTEVRRREYRKKLSGPVIDRVDIIRHVEPVPPHEARDPLARPEPSAAIRERVTLARKRQAERYYGSPWRLNADVPGPELLQEHPLTEAATRMLEEKVYARRLTRRGGTRVHRVAWTVADLRGVERPDVAELDIALKLRTGEPLLLAALAAAR
jgi:magnesium chelatase family protein